MNPAFEESAMLENMIDLMFKDEYDVYVFDTAPTANARRLLGMSKVYSLWVNKMLKSREEAETLREMLSFTKKKQEDPLMEYLLRFRDRMEHGRVLLTDRGKTSFFFVTLPEALPIAVITRFIQWFHDFGIPVGGVLVNMLIDKASVGAEAADFVKNRVSMQDEHMRTVWEKFDGACARSSLSSRPRSEASPCSRPGRRDVRLRRRSDPPRSTPVAAARFRPRRAAPARVLMRFHFKAALVTAQLPSVPNAFVGWKWYDGRAGWRFRSLYSQ